MVENKELENMTMKEKMEYWKAKAEGKEVEPEEKESTEKVKPLYKNYFPLGMGSGISVTLWENSLQLQRREKEGDTWKTTQEIHLARNILEKLYIRIPRLFDLMREQKE